MIEDEILQQTIIACAEASKRAGIINCGKGEGRTFKPIEIETIAAVLAKICDGINPLTRGIPDDIITSAKA